MAGKETLRTERLVLRPVESRDADDMSAMVGDFEVVRHLAEEPLLEGMNEALGRVGVVTHGGSDGACQQSSGS